MRTQSRLILCEGEFERGKGFEDKEMDCNLNFV